MKTTLCSYIFDFCSTSSRVRRLNARVIKEYEKHTDVREVIKTVSDLRILIRSMMTPSQRELFRYQRSRLTRVGADSSSTSSSSSDSDSEWSKIKISQFLKVMQEFTPMSQLDQQLLEGILRRPAKNKQKLNRQRTKKAGNASEKELDLV